MRTTKLAPTPDVSSALISQNSLLRAVTVIAVSNVLKSAATAVAAVTLGVRRIGAMSEVGQTRPFRRCPVNDRITTESGGPEEPVAEYAAEPENVRWVSPSHLLTKDVLAVWGQQGYRRRRSESMPPS